VTDVEPTFSAVGLEQIERRLGEIDRRFASLSEQLDACENDRRRLVEAWNVLISEEQHLRRRQRQLLHPGGA
jgi:hypothetical protein